MASGPAPSPNERSLAWSPALICLVGAADASIIWFTSYRIVKQVFFRNHGGYFSRSWVRGQLLDEGDPNDYSLQLHSQGLDSSTVNLLPITLFKKSEGQSHSNTDCAVCLGEFEEGELLKHLPNCSHAFHTPYSGPVYTLLNTLRREDFFPERSEHYQILRAEILQTSTHRQDT